MIGRVLAEDDWSPETPAPEWDRRKSRFGYCDNCPDDAPKPLQFCIFELGTEDWYCSACAGEWEVEAAAELAAHEYELETTRYQPALRSATAKL